MTDSILYNAHILTMDDRQPYAGAVAISGGRIIAVGTDEEVLKLRDRNTLCRDMRGMTVWPGLTDSHLHILNWAVTAHELVLQPFESKKAMLEGVRAYVLAHPGCDTVIGRGFNEDLWPEKCLPSKTELDAVCPDRSLRLVRICGHMAIANQHLLDEMGITPDTPVPFGGSMDYERGIFCENALSLLYRDDRPAGSLEKCRELLYEGMCHAAQTGLTAIYSDDIGTAGYDMHTVIRAYRELDSEDRMPVRVTLQCALTDDAMFDEFTGSGYAYGQSTGRFMIGPRKLYMDGSLGARTALLSVPYADAPGTRGVSVYTQEEIGHHAVRSHQKGMPFIVHAIGDAAAERVLDAIAYARKAVPGTDDLPDGIVHCQITTENTLRRIRDMHVCVYAQPVFCEYDLHICRDRVGEKLEKTSYQWKTLLQSGVCISSGSDCPVEPLDPMKNIYCAVNRRDFHLQPDTPWLPDQCLTVREAVYCHTVQAARAAGKENVLGRIAPGYLADMTILPADPERRPPEELLHIRPVGTVVAGQMHISGDTYDPDD